MRHDSILFITATNILLLTSCFVLVSCHTQAPNATPTVVFDKIPRADIGGPDKLGTIEGHVTDVRTGQQIVLYAKSQELWWVQPFTEKPYTQIQSNSKWSSQTHLGTEYAALLVNPGYKPPRTTESLPIAGSGIASVA